MASYEVRGPDPDGDWFVVKIEQRGEVRDEMALDEAYDTEAQAKAAAAALNAGGAAQ
jgi:hypothetical protein